MAGTGLRLEAPPAPTATIAVDPAGQTNYVVSTPGYSAASPIYVDIAQPEAFVKEVRMSDWRPLTPHFTRVRMAASATKMARYLNEYGQKFGERVAHMIGNVYTVVENVPPGMYKVYDEVCEAKGVQGGFVYVPFKGISVLMNEVVACEVTGKIGIRYDLHTGCVSEVKPQGRAKALGVQVGWTIYRIDGLPFSDKLLRQKLSNASTPYKIEFLKERDYSGLVMDPRTTALQERLRLQQEVVQAEYMSTIEPYYQSSPPPRVIHLHMDQDDSRMTQDTPRQEIRSDSFDMLLPEMIEPRGMSPEEMDRAFKRERCKLRIKVVIFALICLALAVASWRLSFHNSWIARQAVEEAKTYDKEIMHSFRRHPHHLLYIGIVSMPRNFDQRMKVRNAWVRQANAYYGDRLKVEFILGHDHVEPDGDIDDGQTRRGNAKLVQDEAFEHGDIKRIPVLDTPTFATDKLMWILRSGSDWGAQFVMVVNDYDMVAVQSAVTKLTKRKDVARPAYFGKVWVRNDVQEGDGRQSSYYGGGCYGVSGSLAYKMVTTRLNSHMGFPMYGTSKADVNIAKWVEIENSVRTEHALTTVELIAISNLCGPLTGMAVQPAPIQTSLPQPPSALEAEIGSEEMAHRAWLAADSPK